jgi:bacterioferritin
MKEKVITLLNKARSAELGAIAQYMSHHYEMEDQDFGKLAARIKEIAIAEMKHAEKLAERILFLGGVPTSKQDLDPQKDQSIAEILATDESLEKKAVAMYNEASALCADLRDQKSRDLFDDLVADEEEHLTLFENLKSHIEKLGSSYLATLAGK